jgi:hypothetical protein
MDQGPVCLKDDYDRDCETALSEAAEQQQLILDYEKYATPDLKVIVRENPFA